MDFQFTEHNALMNLSNGEHFTARCKSTNGRFNTVKAPKYYFELELNCHPICEQEFLAMQESDYPEHTNISASLLNFDYPYADLVEVERTGQQIHYRLFITLAREYWLNKASLHCFVPEFIHALSKNNLTAKLEYEEAFGFYLTVSASVPATGNLRSRIKTLSRKIATTQQQTLLLLGEQQ